MKLQRFLPYNAFSAILLLSLIVTAVVVALPQIFTGGGYGPNMAFLTTPSITGPSGTYTKKVRSNGSVYSWSPAYSHLAIGISCEARGFGDVTFQLTDLVVDGTKYGLAQRGMSIGSWGEILSLLPSSAEATWARLSFGWTIPSPSETVGDHNWSAGGNIQLSPYKWKWDVGLKNISGHWVKQTALIQPAASTGSFWTVAMKVACASPSSTCTKGRWVDNDYDHRATCSRCGKRYWSCDSSQAYYHERAGLRDCVNCDDRVWLCQTADGGAHGTTYYCNTCHKSHGLCGNGCPADGDSSGGSSGTTTSPTVQNNGGGTTGSTTGGTSADRVRCGHGRNGNACSRGGWASSREAHKTTCPAGHRYYACSEGGASKHANCRTRRSGEVRCAQGSYCRSGGWASSRNAHQTTCAAGHTYWSCWPLSVSRHRHH